MQRGEHILRNELGRYFDLQEESIGPPARKSTLEYLGGRLCKVDLANSQRTGMGIRLMPQRLAIRC